MPHNETEEERQRRVAQELGEKVERDITGAGMVVGKIARAAVKLKTQPPKDTFFKILGAILKD